MHQILLFITIFFVSISTNAQSRRHHFAMSDGVPAVRSCYTIEADSIRRKKYGLASREAFEKQLEKLVAEYRKSSSEFRQETDTIIIPVIVHIVHNGESVGSGTNISSAQVYSQFDALNEDYNKKPGTAGYNTNPVGASVAIKFVPATIGTSNQALADPGIDRYNGGNYSWTMSQIENSLKPSTIWDPTKYLNIWTVRLGGDLSSTLGYTQLPSFSNLQGLKVNEGSANTDGVVILYSAFGRIGNVVYPYNLGRTATHEIGHFFGLRHIWGDQSNCTGSDYCNDTPPTTAAFYGCPSNPQSCTTGVAAMIQNYMDYTNDACMNVFTNDQVARISTVLQNSPRRKELASSLVYLPTQKPQALFSVNVLQACTGTTISFTDQSRSTPTIWAWKISDMKNTIVYTTSSQNFNYVFNQVGSYSVELIVQNSFGSDTLGMKNYVAIASGQTLSLPFLEDFESTTILGNWLYYNPDLDSTWKVSVGTSAYGIGNKCIFYNNYDSTYDQTGFRNGLLSPKINLATNQNSYLTFDVAYARFYDYNDTLILYYTTDCGTTFTPFWKKGGKNLATSPDTDSFFVPANGEWRREQISLAFLNGQQNIQFMFLNKSGWGNALYLDNLNIFVPVPTSVPGPDFIATPLTICGGGFVSLSDESSQYPTSWNWLITEKNNKIAPISFNKQNPNFQLTVAGIYSIRLVSSNSIGTGAAQTKTNIITVNSAPIFSLSANKNIVDCGKTVKLSTSDATLSYLWFSDYSDNVLTTSLGNTFTDTVVYDVTYTVYGYNAIGCNSSEQVSVSVGDTCGALGIHEEQIQVSLIKVYPNPANYEFWIEREAAIPEELILYNALSVKVLEMKLEGSLVRIRTDNLPKGMYFYQIGKTRGKLLLE